MSDRRPRLFIVLSLLGLLAFAVPGAAKIYKWTDDQGNVHYSDEPAPGSKAVDLPPATVYEAPKPSARPAAPAGGQQQGQQSPQTGYSEFSIAAPADQATIRGTQQTITVTIAMDPALRAGQRIRLEMDGETVASGRQTQFQVHPVYRGTHKFRAVVEDAEGNTVAETPTVTIYKHQPSVN